MTRLQTYPEINNYLNFLNYYSYIGICLYDKKIPFVLVEVNALRTFI